MYTIKQGVNIEYILDRKAVLRNVGVCELGYNKRISPRKYHTIRYPQE